MQPVSNETKSTETKAERNDYFFMITVCLLISASMTVTNLATTNFDSGTGVNFFKIATNTSFLVTISFSIVTYLYYLNKISFKKTLWAFLLYMGIRIGLGVYANLKESLPMLQFILSAYVLIWGNFFYAAINKKYCDKVEAFFKARSQRYKLKD